MESEPTEFETPIYIDNAGLIIIAPFLPKLFETCGLMENNKFINEESKFKAVDLLAYATTGELAIENYKLVLNKLLCGIPITENIEITGDLNTDEKETVDSLLAAVIQHWKTINETSIEGLRTTFLLRNGILEEKENQHYLKVEQKPYDMLLDHIPWNISLIKFNWMQKMIQVAWRV